MLPFTSNRRPSLRVQPVVSRVTAQSINVVADRLGGRRHRQTGQARCAEEATRARRPPGACSPLPRRGRDRERGGGEVAAARVRRGQHPHGEARRGAEAVAGAGGPGEGVARAAGRPARFAMWRAFAHLRAGRPRPSRRAAPRDPTSRVTRDLNTGFANSPWGSIERGS